MMGVIHDPVHGPIPSDGLLQDLLQVPALQRLAHIRQLGFCHLVFPGANHVRLEHVVGVGHLAGNLAARLGLGPAETDLVRAAGFLHDAGHGPYSHTFEALFSRRLGWHHEDVSAALVTGDQDTARGDLVSMLDPVQVIPATLEEHDIDPARVASLIGGLKDIPRTLLGFEDGTRSAPPREHLLSQLIHSTIDADRLDYLLRDSHATGMATGYIDLERYLQTVTLHEDVLMVDVKGLHAVEGILVARALMYSSVYHHKTTRIASLMVERAIDRAAGDGELLRLTSMVDAELMAWLEQSGEHGKRTVARITYRQLYKRVLRRRLDELDAEQRDRLAERSTPDRLTQLEEQIATRAGLEVGEVIVDLPDPGALRGRAKAVDLDMGIRDGDRTVRLSTLSPLVQALQGRMAAPHAVMVAAPAASRESVAKVAEQVLFG